MNEQAIEQAMAHVAELYPPHWMRLYGNLIKEGFDEKQAMEVLKVFILSMGINGVNVNGG